MNGAGVLTGSLSSRKHNDPPHLLPDFRPTHQRMQLLPVQAGAGREGMNKTEMVMVSVPRELLKVASCPCCDGSGGFYDGDGEACQCQWCFERNAILAQPVADEQAEQQPAAWPEFVERAAQILGAEQERLSAEDYLMDSDDCIKVLRETVAAPIAQAAPSPEEVKTAIRNLRCIGKAVLSSEARASMRADLEDAAQLLTKLSTQQPEQGGLVEALEESQSLLVVMLLEPRPASEIESQIIANRAALSAQGGGQ